MVAGAFVIIITITVINCFLKEEKNVKSFLSRVSSLLLGGQGRGECS
jgi:hypothetical protein